MPFLRNPVNRNLPVGHVQCPPSYTVTCSLEDSFYTGIFQLRTVFSPPSSCDPARFGCQADTRWGKLSHCATQMTLWTRSFLKAWSNCFYSSCLKVKRNFTEDMYARAALRSQKWTSQKRRWSPKSWWTGHGGSGEDTGFSLVTFAILS